jgi:hypothetical protein
MFSRRAATTGSNSARASPPLLCLALLAARAADTAAATGAAEAAGAATWTRGAFDTTLTVTAAPFSYAVSLRGAAWLAGGGAAAACGGAGRSTFNGSLAAVAAAAAGGGALTPCDGADARLGAFECVSVALAAADGDAACAFTLAFKYYAARDAFEFSATFPAGGVAGTATAPQPNVGGWPAAGGPWPLSTAFPAFAEVASGDLGFLNTRGNLLSENFAWTRSAFLGSYAGGMEGGPLLLFNASADARLGRVRRLRRRAVLLEQHVRVVELRRLRRAPRRAAAAAAAAGRAARLQARHCWGARELCAKICVLSHTPTSRAERRARVRKRARCRRGGGQVSRRLLASETKRRNFARLAWWAVHTCAPLHRPRRRRARARWARRRAAPATAPAPAAARARPAGSRRRG